MPSPESWLIKGEDVVFADSAATRKGAAAGRFHICGRAAFGGPPADVESFVVAAESAIATSSPLIGHDLGHRISDTYHRSG